MCIRFQYCRHLIFKSFVLTFSIWFPSCKFITQLWVRFILLNVWRVPEGMDLSFTDVCNLILLFILIDTVIFWQLFYCALLLCSGISYLINRCSGIPYLINYIAFNICVLCLTNNGGCGRILDIDKKPNIALSSSAIWCVVVNRNLLGVH